MLFEYWRASRLPITRSNPYRAGFYMHPATADCTLHLSLVPNNNSTQPLEVKIPVSLGAIAVPGRRNGLLPAPWAAAASISVDGAADTTGDMTMSVAPRARDSAPVCLHFVTLTSRPASTGNSGHKSKGSASSQVLIEPGCAQHCLSCFEHAITGTRCVEASQQPIVHRRFDLTLSVTFSCVTCRTRASSIWSYGLTACQQPTVDTLLWLLLQHHVACGAQHAASRGNIQANPDGACPAPTALCMQPLQLLRLCRFCLPRQALATSPLDTMPLRP